MRYAFRTAMIMVTMLSFYTNPVSAHSAKFQNNGTSRVLTQLEKTLQSGKLNFPARLSSNEEVYLVISARAGGGEIIVVGRSSVNPSDLASRLDRIVSGYFPKDTGIEFLTTPEHSMAFARYSSSSVGKMTWSGSIPVSTIISKAKSIGLKPHLVFRLRPYIEVPGLGRPIYRTKNYVYFDVGQVPADGHVNVQTNISISSIAKTIAIITVLPLLSIASLMFGIRVARDTRIEISRRRTLYNRYSVWGVSISLGYNPLPVLLYLNSSHSMPLLDLWFGRLSPMAMVTAILASYGLLASLLVVGSKLRRTYFPVSPDRYIEPKRWQAYPLRFAFLFGGLQFVLQLLVKSTEGLDMQWRVAALLTYFGISALIIRVLWIWWLRTRIASCKVEEGLTCRAQGIAERMGIGIKDVRIDSTADGKNYANARVFLKEGHIMMARKNLDLLTQEEVDWILAREIARVKHITRRQQNVLSRVLAIAEVPLCLVVCMFLFLDTRMTTKLYCALILMPVAVIDTAIQMSTSYNDELASDIAALEATRNLPAAESALRHLIAASENPKLGEKDTTHPERSRRLEALRQTARRLGLPSDTHE